VIDLTKYFNMNKEQLIEEFYKYDNVAEYDTGALKAFTDYEITLDNVLYEFRIRLDHIPTACKDSFLLKTESVPSLVKCNLKSVNKNAKVQRAFKFTEFTSIDQALSKFILDIIQSNKGDRSMYSREDRIFYLNTREKYFKPGERVITSTRDWFIGGEPRYTGKRDTSMELMDMWDDPQFDPEEYKYYERCPNCKCENTK